MRIAVLDHVTVDGNAIGSLTKLAVSQLGEHEVTIFSAVCDLPESENVRWVRVPAIRRPQVAFFVSYHLMAPIVYALWCLRSRRRFDFVQTSESYAVMGDLAYVHFCHRAFLRRCRKEGVKLSLARWMDHRVRAWADGHIYRRRRVIVVPSHRFAEELIEETGVDRSSVVVIPNVFQLSESKVAAGSVAVKWTGPPADGDIVLMFAALGHFERKGLPSLLRALADPALSSFRLMVVGGGPSVVRDYEKMAEELGVGARVAFVGLQADLRPWFEIADAFILPSLYEVFSMVCLEAAASGVPLVISPFCGVNEVIHDGVHGIVVDPGVEGIRDGLLRMAAMSPAERTTMGAMAATISTSWTPQEFGLAWRDVYNVRMKATLSALPPHPQPIPEAAVGEVTGRAS